MKIKLKIGIGSAIAIGIIVMIMASPLVTVLPFHPCQLGFEVPKAHALVAYQPIGQVYDNSVVVVVGTITESFPWCFGTNIVTYMTVSVEEYLKNTLEEDPKFLRMMARGGNIGPLNMWVEDQRIFNKGERVLLFLYNPEQVDEEDDGTFRIGAYSTSIPSYNISNKDLLKGIALRTENNQFVVIKKSQSDNIVFLLDSFFGYDAKTVIKIVSFTHYDSSGNDTSYEDPSDLEQFGIHIESAMITPTVNDTKRFALPVKIDANAKEGKYLINLEAHEEDTAENILHTSWKRAFEQIQVIVED